MKTTILLNLVVLLVTAALAPAATRLVPDEYGTIQAAIDAAVDGDVVIIAPDTYTGDGNRDIDFGGKAITVQSTDPQDPDVVTATVLNCQGTEANPHRGFYFHNSEGPDSVLTGLTITNGYGLDEPVHIHYSYSAGGAIFCTDSSPTITQCNIIGNYAWYIGGGICCSNSSPIVANCTFSGNIAHHGAGMCNKESSPMLVNCTFTGNSVPESGGAMFNYINSNPIIANCTVSGNTARIGGGIRNVYYSSPTITNCIFTGNSADYGGGVRCDDYSSPTINNCTFVGNWAREWGGAILNGHNSSPTISNCTFSGNSALINGNVMANYYGGGPTLSNCILWGNTTNLVSQISLREQSSVSISYCNIQGGEAAIYAIEESWYQWGDGNIDINPLLEPDGYHLQPNSPCIDAGDPSVNYTGQTDIDKQARVIGSSVDIGADEYGTEAPLLIYVVPTQVEFTAPSGDQNLRSETLFICNLGTDLINWSIIEDCPWLSVSEMNGELAGGTAQVTLSADVSDLLRGRYDYDLSVSDGYLTHSPVIVHVILIVHLPGQLHVPDDFGTIQSAIDAACDGDTILVADGHYTGNGNRDLDFCGKRITVRSINGPMNCIIDCEGATRGFYFHSNEGTDSVLEGFTITNGHTTDGGGIYCRDSSPRLVNCRFNNNSAVGFGGAMENVDSNPVLIDCVFSQNRAERYSGGALENYQSHPTLINCTFSQNSAREFGGAVYDYESNPKMTNCIFSDNYAVKSGGGIYEHFSNSSITNCIFSENSAGRDGGGIKNWNHSKPMITNCTFTKNSAGNYGGALCSRRASNPKVNNCIMWDNTAPQGGNIYLALYSWAGNTYTTAITVSYSDVEGGESGAYVENGCTLNWGEGNIDADPLFVEPGYWDANGVWVDGDYRLLQDSPCIDSGDPNYIAEPNETDLDGRPRVIGGRIDMGAYEYSPPIPAEVRIVPRTINLTSKGKWITSLFWLPEDYDVADIDPNSVVLEFLDEEIEAELLWLDEEQQVAIVRFSRSEVQDILAPGEVELTVSGELADGTVFEGTDVIRVIDKGKKLNQPPNVTITKPQDGAVFGASETIEIEANAWDVDGSVVKVEFFADESKIGEDNDGTDGWKSSWNNHPVGSYSLTAKATDNDGAATTSPAVGITVVETPLPGQASNPNPADGATSVSLYADLSWTAGSNAASHDVYFGMTSPGAFRGNQTATTFDPGTMAYTTMYYWRIDEVNAGWTTTGTVWSFTTGMR